MNTEVLTDANGWTAQEVWAAGDCLLEGLELTLDSLIRDDQPMKKFQPVKLIAADPKELKAALNQKDRRLVLRITEPLVMTVFANFSICVTAATKVCCMDDLMYRFETMVMRSGRQSDHNCVFTSKCYLVQQTLPKPEGECTFHRNRRINRYKTNE